MQNPSAPDPALPPENRSPHSADQFGAQRDFWWNPDFLDLMARRWRLDEVSSLADIGCGVGHWSRLLYPRLRSGARLIGIDREPSWVREAGDRFRKSFPQVPAELILFKEGDATAIPLPDASCDAVTCQTVLMHLARPMDALGEMLRIVRPGGLLICVEPNNLWNCLATSSLTEAESTDRVLRRFELFFRCHRGRIAAGEGDHNVGDLLPGWFSLLGLNDIRVHQNDRTAAIFPPYATPAQQALLAQDASKAVPWDREELLRLYVLGGGSPERFEAAFLELVDTHAREQQAIQDKVFHAGYGGISYLVSGRRPRN